MGWISRYTCSYFQHPHVSCSFILADSSFISPRLLLISLSGCCRLFIFLIQTEPEKSLNQAGAWFNKIMTWREIRAMLLWKLKASREDPLSLLNGCLISQIIKEMCSFCFQSSTVQVTFLPQGGDIQSGNTPVKEQAATEPYRLLSSKCGSY